jgi:hypothetical protein
MLYLISFLEWPNMALFPSMFIGTTEKLRIYVQGLQQRLARSRSQVVNPTVTCRRHFHQHRFCRGIKHVCTPTSLYTFINVTSLRALAEAITT